MAAGYSSSRARGRRRPGTLATPSTSRRSSSRPQPRPSPSASPSAPPPPRSSGSSTRIPRAPGVISSSAPPSSTTWGSTRRNWDGRRTPCAASKAPSTFGGRPGTPWTNPRSPPRCTNWGDSVDASATTGERGSATPNPSRSRRGPRPPPPAGRSTPSASHPSCSGWRRYGTKGPSWTRASDCSDRRLPWCLTRISFPLRRGTRGPAPRPMTIRTV
mmetsp:Transcript_35927/g.107355  ORF Transcript_35927/g.107355 Transcript_35927/m.107355 type:complete len:216 (+) Transcript_35927:1365-2012(+)